MPYDVIVLRPEADFKRVDAMPPGTFSVTYRAPDDPELPQLMKQARALVIPAVGARLPGIEIKAARVRLGVWWACSLALRWCDEKELDPRRR